jgi:molybdopterin molybdotransferase
MSTGDLRSIDDHVARVRSLAAPLPPQTRSLRTAVGCVLAEQVVARLAVPPFDNSAMDGFAVRAADLAVGVGLDVVGDIPAGTWPDFEVGRGQAARVMTGGPIPVGADTVVPVELTDQPRGAAALPHRVLITELVDAGRHVRRAGENVARGNAIADIGMRVTPALASSAASVGYPELLVIPRPRVALIATGSELVAPGAPLCPGQIPDSNSTLVAALVEQFGAEVASVVTVGDDHAAFAAALTAALDADLIVTTGGVSVGAFDVVRDVVADRIEFASVAMQPGKPQASGMIDGVPFVGLPGNPVSVFVSAWVFLREVIGVLAGAEQPWLRESLPVAEGWNGPGGRRQFVPVAVGPGGVTPVHRLGSGSHLVASLALAEGLAVVPEGQSSVSAGDLVDFYATHSPATMRPPERMGT